MKTYRAIALLVALLPACVPDPGTDCIDKPSALASIDAATPLGFTAAEVLAGIEGEHMLDLTWSDEGPVRYKSPGTSGAKVTVAYAGGEVRFVDSKQAEDGDADIDPDCSPRLEIDVALTFNSEDGAFDETWTVTLEAREVGVATWTAPASPGSLTGSLAVSDFVVDDGHTITGGDLHGSFVAGAAEGDYLLGVRSGDIVSYGALGRFVAIE